MPSNPAGKSNSGSSVASKQKTSTRNTLNVARQRELEHRRARGEAVCAECRRLKMKCDKKVPCSLCTRRGCQTICPNGELTSGQGSRLVLASTETLYDKLSQMSQRIRQLEDALQIMQSNITEQPHPLLSEELLLVKSGVDMFVRSSNMLDETNGEEAITRAMGTLAVSDGGATRFLGRVGTETLLVEAVDDVEDHCQTCSGTGADKDLELPEYLVQVSKGFPFVHAHLPREQLVKLLKEHLPSYERATALVEACLENSSWLPQLVRRDEIMENLLPFIYERDHTGFPSWETEVNEGYTGTHSLHSMALAFAVFACGAAADLTVEPNNQEGKLYHELALASLNAHPVIHPGGASLETVQAIGLNASYDIIAAAPSTSEPSTKTFLIGLVISASIGLHRDPAHWNMEHKYVQQRRHAFWELFTVDKWKSLATGRPSIFRLQEVDCDFPEDEEAFVNEGGNTVEGLSRWRYRFSKEILAPLSELMCLTRPVKYSELLEFDRKIRDFKHPYFPPYSGPIANVRDQLWILQKEIALLSIHRNFFALALVKECKNPLLSPFAPSCLAAHACSIRILRIARFCFDQNPGATFRFWPIWSQCIASGVIIGSLICRSDQYSWAKLSFQDLNIAVSLLEDASRHPVARRGLPLLLRLRDRARLVLQKLCDDDQLPSDVRSFSPEMEELTCLRGEARLVHRHNKSSRSTTNNDEGAHSSRVPSHPPTLMEFSDTLGSTPVTTSGTIDVRSGTKPSYGSLLSDSALSAVQPSSNTIEQDMQSILNMTYDSTYDDFNRTIDALLSGIGSHSQGPCEIFPEQVPRRRYDTDNTQLFGAFTATSNPWVADTGQPDFLQSHQSASAVSSQNAHSTTPMFDVSWHSGYQLGESSEMSIDAAQFLEDWQLLASIESKEFSSNESNIFQDRVA